MSEAQDQTNSLVSPSSIHGTGNADRETGPDQTYSNEQNHTVDINGDDARFEENESLIESLSSRETAPQSHIRRSSEGTPLCIVLCVVLPAIFGLVVFAVYELSDYSKSGSGALKPNGGSMLQVVPTILISIDGFRHDYLYRTTQSSGKGGRDESVPLAPALQSLSSRGVTASPGMQPVMPTVTFPNHWSLATGLYPASHGIVSNTMYDTSTQEWFHYSGNGSHWWLGEPIWETIRKTPRFRTLPNGTQYFPGGNFTTASVFWVGTDIVKHAPTVFWKYDAKVPYDKRVERVMDLLTGKAKDLDGKADFVTTYFETVDHAGHKHGPESPEVNTEIVRVDQAIGSLISKLNQEFGENYNMIVVSDHGMSEVDDSRVVNLTTVIPLGTVQDVEKSPFGLWLNVSESSDQVYSKIKQYLSESGMRANVYKKHELPERWHLSQSLFIPPIVTLADLGWTVEYPHQTLVPGARMAEVFDGNMSRYKRHDKHRENERGTHGFDNEILEMYALFIAAGPSFQSGKYVSGLRSIDVYPMLCQLFGASPAPNNGSLAISTKHILANDGSR